MGKLAITLAAAALMVGSLALTANAAQSLGASSLHQAAQNATPIVKEAACHGWGRWCPPGRVRVCGPYRCWCRACY